MVKPNLFNGFPELFRSREKYLLRLARKVTRHEDLAREAVSAATVKFLGYGYWESAPPHSWLPLLTKIVKTCAADQLRQSRRTLSISDRAGSGDDDDEAPADIDLNGAPDWHRGLQDCADPIEVIHRRRVAQALQNAIDRLSLRQRQALLETHLGGSTRYEVAAQLNIKAESVKTHLKKAVAKLRGQPALRSLMAELSI